LDKGLAGKWDDISLCSSFVLFDGNIYKMWYTGSDNAYMKIGEARSLDGVKWTKTSKQPILSTGSSNNWDFPRVQDPRIIISDDTYHMWFSGGGYFTWCIGYAKASDPLDPVDIFNNIQIKNPEKYVLTQNYPNPFNPSTTIKFQILNSEFTTLKVYNILGKEVTTLVSNKLNQGNHTYQFDGRNLASGIYYYQLIAGDYREVKKMILLR